MASHRVALCLLAVAALAAAQGEYVRVWVPGEDAICLDGTPAAYYFHAGSGSGADKWLVFLEVQRKKKKKQKNY